MTDCPVASNARRSLPLSFEDVTRLAAELGAESFGYAVRLVSYQAAFGRGIQEASIPTFLGISSRKWAHLRSAMLHQFDVRDGQWILLSAERMLEGSAPSIPWAVPAQTMRVPAPPIPKSLSQGMPLLTAGMELAPGRPLPTRSLSQQLFATGTQLLMANGQCPERQARAKLARLIRDHAQDRGLVFEAIDAAWRNRDGLVDPYPWIVQWIKRRKAAIQPQNRGARPRRLVEASPEGMQISASSMERLQQRTAKIRSSILEEDAS